MFTGCNDGVARAYDARSGVLKAQYKGHNQAISCMKVANDKLYTGSYDKTMKVWDIKDVV